MKSSVDLTMGVHRDALAVAAWLGRINPTAFPQVKLSTYAWYYNGCAAVHGKAGVMLVAHTTLPKDPRLAVAIDIDENDRVVVVSFKTTNENPMILSASAVEHDRVVLPEGALLKVEKHVTDLLKGYASKVARGSTLRDVPFEEGR